MKVDKMPQWKTEVMDTSKANIIAREQGDWIGTVDTKHAILIAAAPELLDALTETVERLEDVLRTYVKWYMDDNPDFVPVKTHPILDNARSVANKARGIVNKATGKSYAPYIRASNKGSDHANY